ncbi:MAG TPA: molybdenum cofactor biosynthesis protein MoaE [Thermoanaerobaculia bacterium]|nr:molybdenum cofactor biosynthesis protein MoaE [Thermoanaerobaculia bacterium]
MKIRLLAFASAGDALGAGEMDLELPAGSRVVELRERLDRDFPKLAPLWPRLAVAVDGRVVSLDEPLQDGAEVALLPPVSGGSGSGAAEPLTGITHDPIDAERVTASVAGPERGAVVVFHGTVRNHHQGRPVGRLSYSAYPSMAESRLRQIVADLETASPGLRAAIVHRLGEVPVGEASVVIAVASPHRAAAYEASRTALERLKAEVPIWKQEHYADGETVWREEEPLTAAR